MTQPTPVRTPPAGGSGKLARWAATHKGQAAGIAGAAGVAVYALYKRRQASSSGTSTAAASTANGGTLAPYYDPTTGQYIDPVSGMPVGAPTLSGYGSPGTAGGMPASSAPSAADLAALQAELDALYSGQGYGQPTPAGSGTTPGMTGASGAPAVNPPRILAGSATTPAQARAIDPNIGSSSVADQQYLAGGLNSTEQRINAIATNRGITLTPAQEAALANRALDPTSSSSHLTMDQIRSQIDRGIIT